MQVKKALTENRIKNVMPLMLSLLIVIAVGLFSGFYFSSNDDIMLHNLMSGSYTGNPEAHLIYIMYPLGLMFKALYTILPNVEWYGIYIISGYLLCCYEWLHCFGRLNNTKQNKTEIYALSTVLLLLLMGKFLVAYQYTVFAGVMIVTAMLIFASAKEDINVGEKIISALLLINGCLLRKEVFFMLAPMLVLLIIKRAFDIGDLRALIKKYWGLGVCIWAAIVVSFIIDAGAYSLDDWKMFKEYNNARTSVYDYALFPEYDSNVDFYDSLGIDQSKYIALKQYDVLLVDDVDTALLNAMAEKQSSILEEWKQYYNVPLHDIKLGVLAWLQVMVTPVGVMSLVTVMLTTIYSLLKKRRKLLLYTLLNYGYVFLVTLVLAVKDRFPERVFFPLYLACFIAIVAEGLKNVETVKRKTVVNIVGIIGAILLLSWAVRDIELSGKECLKNASEWEALNEYIEQDAKENEGFYYCVDTSLVSNISERMFSGSLEYEKVLRLGSWVMESPIEEARERDVRQDGLNPAIVVPKEYADEWILDLCKDAKLLKY